MAAQKVVIQDPITGAMFTLEVGEFNGEDRLARTDGTFYVHSGKHPMQHKSGAIVEFPRFLDDDGNEFLVIGFEDVCRCMEAGCEFHEQ